MIKKFFLVLTIILLSVNTAFAAHSEAFKQDFYNGFISGMFENLEITLIERNIPKEKAHAYSTALKGRVNKDQLVQSSWPCLSKLTEQEINSQKGLACMQDWTNNFMLKNSDLMNLLK